MTYIKPPTSISIASQDSFSIDPFGRWRVSQPLTIFDSKQIHDSQPLFWDDQEVIGSGTSTAHRANEASTRISVGDGIAGVRVRQTYQRFNYQPSKGQLIFLTWGNIQALNGNYKLCGYTDDKNGLFFKNINGIMSVVRRTYSSGVAIDNAVIQSSWNYDKMDGTGVSGVDLDFTKTQIGIIDFEWLGVGRVRMGFVVDGKIFYCHTFDNANNLSLVYMSTPNLPIRYEIGNSGSGAGDYFDHICSSVSSEGGQDKNGALRHKDSGAISGLSSGTTYAMVGIKLKTTHQDISVILENLSLLATTTNDTAHWELKLNPTIAGTFTYSDETNSCVQTAIGSNANVVTGGVEIDGGFFTTSQSTTVTIPNALKLGASIVGVSDTIVLCCRPITNNITVHSSITWRELN